jgi:chromosome segregation ATPase
MNANEHQAELLAWKIENAKNEQDCLTYAGDAPDMLRTIPALESNLESMAQTNEAMGKKLLDQQSEIDFLKKEIREKHEDCKWEGQQAANARAELEELKAGSEPAVWIFSAHLMAAKKMVHLCRVTPTQVREDYTPLYMHPSKTLTEPSVKEIEDLWLDVVNNIPSHDKRPREWHFARAILKKASEK